MRRFNWFTTLGTTGLVFGLMFQVSAMAQDAEGRTAQVKGFTDIVFSGGITGLAILILLLCLSLTAVYLVIEHLLTLRAKDIMPTDLGIQLSRSHGSRISKNQFTQSRFLLIFECA